MTLTDKAEAKMNKDKFYSQGRKAREDGKLKSSNPYNFYLDYRKHLWDRGWNMQNEEMLYDEFLPNSFV